MDKEKEYNIEKREIDVLIGRGVNFEVEQVTFKRKKGFFGRFMRREKVTESVKYTIKEPTLAVLDLISAEQIDLRIDENIMSSDASINEAKKLTAEHCRRMARILALSVLGQDYIIASQYGPFTRFDYDEKKLDNLTGIFFAFIKPSKLLQLAILVNTISNLGDFTNSIRLMSANRTTMPDRIGANKEG